MAGAEGLRVVRKERVDGAEETVGAERAAEDGHQAGGELAERTDEVDVGFATEELAALVETAVVGLDAGLEHEGHLVTVAEVFRTLETEAGAEFSIEKEFTRSWPAMSASLDTKERLVSMRP